RTRFAIWHQIHETLTPLFEDPTISVKSLRHFRITHLGTAYQFNPYDLIAMAGWTFRAGLGSMGQPSGQLDSYFHIPWQTYFPKLLVPIDDIMYGEPSLQQVSARS
ncbi:hypothetical protein MUP77_19675, partial [Candidatus Bathyarchaeota archaeon]|nr:hypothetical protein [Candidatus Bathyarchaeota archaeon]